jgi:hypothetical protein
MKQTIGLVGTAVLLCSASAFADPNSSSRGGTMVRAIEVTTQNQAKNPDSPGLPRARARLVENAARHAANPHRPGATGVERAQDVDRVQRVERPERPERVERVDLATRLETARAHRPDRPQPKGRN